MTKEFLKEKIFTILMILLSLGIVIMDITKGDTSHMVWWLVIAGLNVITLVRDYMREKKK